MVMMMMVVVVVVVVVVVMRVLVGGGALALCFTHLIALNKLSISGSRYTTFMFVFHCLHIYTDNAETRLRMPSVYFSHSTVCITSVSSRCCIHQCFSNAVIDESVTVSN